MQQRIVSNIGLPYLSLETDAGLTLAQMTIHRTAMPDIVRTLIQDCYHNGTEQNRAELLAILREAQCLITE